ncbi:MAG: protein-L-isoaspartate(D-aspartate) O-methyltransferase [Methylococcales bacterium]|jgi:protein-L-isoaspartate(D-aspartate) O-methyltransferase|nr:protein-L-isoaspartate(D-aspartate) O-methyltransferase [Methylococcales bacterium]MBT7445438.1 protein-L-isoaspartate(D-aspartate) O-methyltransferase [Methylococcales bacterium]
MNARHLGIGMTSQRTRSRLIGRLLQGGVTNKRLLDVMETTPRHIFVDEALASRAYEDTALPIGHGQTISQPYIVARMTEVLLENGPLDHVLEIGTGSGYQTAILSQLVPRVYTVERIEPLLSQARKRFQELRFSNIRTKYTDGIWGWKEHGPYKGIIVTAAPAEIPQPLLEQLAIGGRMVIPVGRENQALAVIERTAKGYESRELEQVKFVPLVEGTA